MTAQGELQFVHGEGKFGQGVQLRFPVGAFGRLRFQTVADSLKSFGQGPAFIGVAQGAQQGPDLFRLLTRPANQASRRLGGLVLRFDGLQERADKRSALLRPIGVDSTPAIGPQRAARLGETGFAAGTDG
jgi:hypothetical protein